MYENALGMNHGRRGKRKGPGDSARVEGARDQREGVCAGELVLAEEAGAAFRDRS